MKFLNDVDVTGTGADLSCAATVTFSNLPNSTETVSVMINSSGVLSKRTLLAGAFKGVTTGTPTSGDDDKLPTSGSVHTFVTGYALPTTGGTLTGGLTLEGTTDQILILKSTDDGPVYQSYYRGTDRHAYVGFGGSSDTFHIVNEESGGSINFKTASTSALTIGSDQVATFAANVTAGSNSLTAGSLDINGAADISGVLTQGDHIELASAKRIRWGAGDALIQEGVAENYALEFHTYNSSSSSMTEALRLSGDNTATFKGDLAISAGALSITGDGSNAATLTESGSGDFTIHAQDDLRLNANGHDIVLQGASNEFGRLTNSSQNFVIQNTVQDKDIIFRGNDNGETLTALTFDMSEGGNATFSGNVTVGSNSLTAGSLDINGNADISGNLTLSGGALIGDPNWDIYAEYTNRGRINLLSNDSADTNTQVALLTNGNQRLRIDKAGTVSISGVLDMYDRITSYNAGSMLRKSNTDWSNAENHDILYQGWNANTGDYIYLKAPGNSATDHGTAFIGDDVIAFGRSDVEIGAVDNDSATAPLSENWFVLNSTSATFAGDITTTGDIAANNINLTDAGGGNMIILDSSTGDGIIRWEDNNTQKWDLGRDNTDNALVISNEGGLNDNQVLHISHSTGRASFGANIIIPGFTLDGNTITGVNDSDEFDDDDAHIMTSAAINDRILASIRPDWTVNIEGASIHAGNYLNTTYTNATSEAAGLMSTAHYDKLEGIAASANNYTLPAASHTAIGGVKFKSSTAQSTGSNDLTTDADRTYAIQKDGDGAMCVNVPWVSVSDGDTSTKGKVQLASTAEAQAKTNSTKVLTPATAEAQIKRKTESFIIALSGASANIEANEDTIVEEFYMPYAFTLTSVRISVKTAGATAITVDVLAGGNSIFAGDNKISIDGEEFTSVTATTGYAFTGDNENAYAVDDNTKIQFKITAVGEGTSGAGLKAYLIGYQT